jgi:hypothetical protein
MDKSERIRNLTSFWSYFKLVSHSNKLNTENPNANWKLNKIDRIGITFKQTVCRETLIKIRNWTKSRNWESRLRNCWTKSRKRNQSITWQWRNRHDDEAAERERETHSLPLHTPSPKYKNPSPQPWISPAEPPLGPTPTTSTPCPTLLRTVTGNMDLVLRLHLSGWKSCCCCSHRKGIL